MNQLLLFLKKPSQKTNVIFSLDGKKFKRFRHDIYLFDKMKHEYSRTFDIDALEWYHSLSFLFSRPFDVFLLPFHYQLNEIPVEC